MNSADPTRSASGASPPAPVRKRYHHGNLHSALLDAATDLAAAGGPPAVQLRDAARRVGVSHNAGYRHFANRDALLDAVADRGFDALTRAMQAAMSEVPAGLPAPERARERMRAVGRGYLRFATNSPGLFRTAFATRHQPGTRSAPAPGELDAFALLVATVDDLVTAGVLPPERRPYSELVAWSCVHGLALLVLDGPLQALTPQEWNPVLERLLDVYDAGV